MRLQARVATIGSSLVPVPPRFADPSATAPEYVLPVGLDWHGDEGIELRPNQRVKVVLTPPAE